MAIYEYQCKNCNIVFEKIMSMADFKKKIKCDICNKNADKLLSLPSTGGSQAEPWEYEYTHKMNPKFVRDSKGNRLKFNPNTMKKGRKGAG